MKVQKSILKTCTVLMAAEMALSPVTVKASGLDWQTLKEKSIPIGETGIAEEGGYYKMPSCGYPDCTEDWTTGKKDYRNGILYVGFDRRSSDVSFGTVPNGYKGISIDVGYLWTEYGNEMEGGQEPYFYYSMDAENSQNWVKTDLDDGYVTKYNFTVDCDGTTYSECWMAFCPEAGIGEIEAVVPQQYNGAVTFTINGMKLENGETVKDEETSLTYYLQGNGTSTMQPTSPEPTADQQPAEQTADPQPAEPAADTAAEKYNTYVTKPGDSLMKLAKELYGDKKQWTAIYELNKDKIKNPNVIYANMELVLP